METRKKAESTCSTNTADQKANDQTVRLKKELGLIDGIGVIIGVIIGSGIFVSPKGVLIHSGSILMCLVVWLLTGVLSTFGACCYAELGAAIPKSGGEFAYLNASFGPLLAFLYLWVALLIIMPTGNAIIALTFAEYILQPYYGTCPTPQLSVKLLAMVVISNLFCNRGVKFVITSSQQTCFESGLVDYALILCRKVAAKLPLQVYVISKMLQSENIDVSSAVEMIFKSRQAMVEMRLEKGMIQHVLVAAYDLCNSIDTKAEFQEPEVRPLKKKEAIWL
ncbi:Y+L amino acid transporter 2 [Araneus ventricosus]|uniref:Y+L amino acid transporter 2 n=1 Tax=Araneus ventricosus TaxID=182803 RepID=A0A4Y2CCI9_ARAVE|nr:Y+L amino acid transporter 2 [Araneus ventricosus]